MAQRGILPKIRPAIGNPSGRPSVRPVRPAPAPPRPAKPRKTQSGFATNVVATSEPRGARDARGARGDGVPGVVEDEPPTQSKPRAYPDLMESCDETRARPVDGQLLAQTRGVDARYASLPSLDVPRAYDSYEGASGEREPATRRAASRQGPRDDDSYPIPVEVGSGARERPIAPSPWDERREASGPQPRAWVHEPQIPPAPRVPRDARGVASPPFVVGVQPLRTPAAAYSTAVPYSAMPQTVPPRAPASHPHAMQMQQMQQMQMQHLQQMQMQMHRRQHAQMAPSQMAPPRQGHVQTGPATYRQPVGPSLQADTTRLGAKAGRFAWFVFGAAFGVAFALLAWSVVPRFGAAQPDHEPLFPPGATLPGATTAAPLQAPAPVAAPPVTAPPIVAAAPSATMTVASPSALPPAPAAAPVAAPQAPPPVVRVAPPSRPRTTWVAPRRPAEPAVPKPVFTGGATSDGAPASDVNDILAGALRP